MSRKRGDFMRLQMKAHNHPGYLFVFCGLDGSGKTTQIALLEQFFSRIDMPAYITKQPTDAVRSSAMFRTYMDSPDHSMITAPCLCCVLPTGFSIQIGTLFQRFPKGEWLFQIDIFIPAWQIYAPGDT